GLGLDQSTSITVHGDTLTVNGPKRVAVWDGKEHDGKPYYYLRKGDTLNTATRVATIADHSADPVRKEIKLSKNEMSRYVGAYRMSPGRFMMITIDSDHLVSQLTGQGTVPLAADADGTFYPTSVDAQLEFTKDQEGKITTLVLHQNGHSVPMDRLP